MSKKNKKSDISPIWTTIITTAGVIIVALLAFPPFQKVFEPKPSPTAVSTDTPAASFTETFRPALTFTLEPGLPIGMQVKVIANPSSGKAPLKVKIDARDSFVRASDGEIFECRNGACIYTWYVTIPGEQPDRQDTENGIIDLTFNKKGTYYIGVYICHGANNPTCASGETAVIVGVTSTPATPSQIPPPTINLQTATPSLQPLDVVATEAKQQFDDAFESNIAFVYPQSMDLGNTVVFELRLSPLESSTQLVATVVKSRGLTPVGTSAFSDLQGNSVFVESSSNIRSTQLIKAELKSQNPDAFTIERLHADDIQISNNGIWQWSITSKRKGVNYLTLNIYMLFKVDDQDIWTQVQSYEKSIEVIVKPLDQISSFDWKWIAGILIPALFIPLIFRWYDKNRKKLESQKPTTKGKR